MIAEFPERQCKQLIYVVWSRAKFSLLSYYLLISKHFGENRLTLWRTVAMFWCNKLCAVFLDHAVHTAIDKALCLKKDPRIYRFRIKVLYFGRVENKRAFGYSSLFRYQDSDTM